MNELDWLNFTQIGVLRSKRPRNYRVLFTELIYIRITLENGFLLAPAISLTCKIPGGVLLEE